MSWFSEAWDKVEDAVGDIWDSVVDVCNTIYDEIARWCTKIWDYIVDNLWELIVLAGGWLVNLAALVVAAVVAVVVWCVIAVGVIGWAIYEFGGWIVAIVSEFLDWIHYDTLKDLHDVALIVSDDYREMWAKVYAEVAKWADQIGVGADHAIMFLTNARNLVLSTSSIVGKSYDLAQLEWTGELGAFLTDVQRKSGDYKNDPLQFLGDLQEWFEPTRIQTQSAIMLNIYGFMDTSANLAKEMARNLSQVRDDLEKTIIDLPGKISKPIYNSMAKGFDKFDTIIKDEVNPILNKLDQVTEVLKKATDVQGIQITNIEGLVSNPGKLLSNINQLPEVQRLEQEAQITEISTRAFSTEATVRNQTIAEGQQELARISNALRTERLPPSFLSLEYEGEPKPTTIPGVTFSSWQVGDY